MKKFPVELGHRDTGTPGQKHRDTGTVPVAHTPGQQPLKGAVPVPVCESPLSHRYRQGAAVPVTNGKKKFPAKKTMVTKIPSRPNRSQRGVAEEIASVRAAWQMTEPTRGRLPKWFTAAVRSAVRSRRVYCVDRIGDPLTWLTNSKYRALFDHPGAVVIDGERLIVAEPYETSVSIDRARAMADELAGVLGCETWTSMKSWHYPGYTIRVCFAERKSPAASWAETETAPTTKAMNVHPN